VSFANLRVVTKRIEEKLWGLAWLEPKPSPINNGLNTTAVGIDCHSRRNSSLENYLKEQWCAMKASL